jgi:hypothetical protein
VDIERPVFLEQSHFPFQILLWWMWVMVARWSRSQMISPWSPISQGICRVWRDKLARQSLALEVRHSDFRRDIPQPCAMVKFGCCTYIWRWSHFH